LFTPERSKEEIQEKSQDQTLRAEENTILVQQRIVSTPSQYFDTTNHKKSQCDFAFKADQVPKL
jgi:hypothetical protein